MPTDLFLPNDPDLGRYHYPYQMPAASFNELNQPLPVLPAPLASASDSIDLKKLTLREKEIVFWILRGKPDWQIAEILAISRKTVNFHVERFKRKLNAATRTQAIVIATRLGLLDEPGDPPASAGLGGPPTLD
jgi:DNA-binding CsgD family transcriptional regulator